MIEEYVREMSAEERASLERTMGWQPPTTLWYTLRAIDPEAKWLAGFGALALVVALATVGRVSGGITAALAGAGLFGTYQLAALFADQARMRRRRTGHGAKRGQEIARMLQDGRVTVKRVRAVAVVEIEPIEDEGYGYVFDLGDGRVLFLKGQDFDVADDEAPWPNTEFEIVRAATDGTMLGLRCHGTALRPLRVIPGGELDALKGWDAREEVLEMTVDEAVRSVLENPDQRPSRENPPTG